MAAGKPQTLNLAGVAGDFRQVVSPCFCVESRQSLYFGLIFCVQNSCLLREALDFNLFGDNFCEYLVHAG